MSSAQHLQSIAYTPAQSGDISPAIVDEIVNAAFLVAATSSTANCLARADSGLAPAELLSYLPPRLTSKPADFADPAAENFVGALNAFDHRLAMLCEFSRLAVQSNDYKPDFAVIAITWRRAASQAKALITKLDAGSGSRLRVGNKEPIRLARLLLEAAEREESPCIDESGLVAVPVPIERRAALRLSASRIALFDLNGVIQQALVKNVSSRGLGVEGLDGAAAGNEILLMIGPSQSVAGQIVWVQGLEAGIRLDALLPQSFVSALID